MAQLNQLTEKTSSAATGGLTAAGPGPSKGHELTSFPSHKILECYVNLEFGGLASTLLTEISGLKARGHQLYLALQEIRGELCGQLDKEVPTFDLGYRSPASYPRMLWQLIRLVRIIKPQIIIPHTWNLGVMALIASRCCAPRPKVVFIQHTQVEYLDLFNTWNTWLIKKVARLSLSWADAIVTLSPGCKDGIAKHLRVPATRIRVIPSLVNLTKTRRDADMPVADPWFQETDRVPLIIGCGPLLPAKDFPTLLRAFAGVRKQDQARLALIGDGPLKAMLLDLAAKLGITDDFKILGYQPHPAKYMARATIFAHSSVVEGFGKVLVEALLLGLPVVATAVAGPSFILDRGRYGKLVPPGDDGSMAEAILTLLRHDSLRKALAESGPQRASFFSPEKSIDRLEQTILGR